MPSPKNARSLAEARAECLSLGIKPGRSIAECEARIEGHKRAAPLRAWAVDLDREATPVAAEAFFRDAAAHGTGIMRVTTPGNARHVAFAEALAASYEYKAKGIYRTEEGADGLRRIKGIYANECKTGRPKGVSIRDHREAKRRARQARMTHQARKG